jgi:hypothetical protein
MFTAIFGGFRMKQMPVLIDISNSVLADRQGTECQQFALFSINTFWINNFLNKGETHE